LLKILIIAKHAGCTCYRSELPVSEGAVIAKLKQFYNKFVSDVTVNDVT